MDIRLDGKVALVTGASSGLGERFAIALAESGARVALAARQIDKLEHLKTAIVKAGGAAFPVALDVTKVAEIDPVVERIERELGPIDILINNSGVSVQKRYGDYTEADFDYMMDTNAKGTLFVAQSVGRRMLARGQGRIINIASVAAVKVVPGIGAYGMTKAAVVQMTKGMAVEWGRRGVNVNAILPGYIETGMNREYWATEGGKKLISILPRKRVGQPSDLDGLIVYLASDGAHFVNGAIIPADDGMTAT
jgi:NAD(P)-dependent dehydrogenase (short-subunit alcohol dehydrogenase family)